MTDDNIRAAEVRNLSSPTLTGTFTPPIYDQLIQAQARIAELEAEKEERDKPCVWTRDFDERNECIGLTAACNEWSYEYRSRFCPNCGHPIEVKEESDGL